MPGRRNLARERAQHDAVARFQTIHTQLTTALPHLDRAVVGRRRILAHLETLGVRRLNGQPLTWRIVNAWRTKHACPILRGNRSRCYAAPAVTTTHALTAWLLSAFHHGDVFRVTVTATFDPQASFPASGAGSSNRAA